MDFSTVPILTGVTSLIPQAWSLVIEGFFYLCAPLLALTHARARPLFFAVMAASFAVNVYVLARGLSFDSWIYQSSFAAPWVFVLGMTSARVAAKKVVAIVVIRRVRRPRRPPPGDGP